MTKTVGIALGGGGAKGLAHLLMLEVLDDLGVVPIHITGTSIGAIVGALYASGMSAEEARSRIEELTTADAGSLRDLMRGSSLKWLKFLGIEWSRGGILDTDGFLEHFNELLGVKRFDELKLRLSVIATAFWLREEVVLETGEILPAIRASMALPGIFQPVVREGKVLVDGGATNPVPFDVLDPACDVTIGVSVLGTRAPKERGELPNVVDGVFNTFSIMEASIVREKRRLRPPTIYVEPDIEGVRILEFHKANQVFAQAEPARDQLRRELERALAG
jgi:NTE family protein